MNYIAHIRESDHQIQTVEEHLLAVKKLAESFGEKLGVKHIAGLAGLLHDLGKYTNKFKDYIWKAVHDPGSAPPRGSVNHSTAGGKLLYDLFHTGKIDTHRGLLAEVVGNAIISHHSYLQDFLRPDLESDYLRRVRDSTPDEYEWTIPTFFEHVMSEADFREYVDRAADELGAYLNKKTSASSEMKLMFLTKFIFSALIDADRTNTRLFEENKTFEPELEHIKLFSDYYKKLMLKLNSFADQSQSQSAINQLRSKMSERCEDFAGKPSGVYTLSIPTGGGKTLASLRNALKHAMTYRKKHIIYIVPYTTIIEQNAAEVRKILKDDANILEHHSNVVIDDSDENEDSDDMNDMQQKLKLAKDNWDSPIIFTTMVQFLNVFYAKGSRNIRRLHNLAESVIIFDEVQKVPVPCVSLFNEAVNFLRAYGHSSIVLCTATQPALDFVEHKLEMGPDAEMIDNLDQVIEAFKRVEVIDRATDEAFNNESLCEFVIEKMEDSQSVLVILNTKSVVKKLYQILKTAAEHIPVYHLSTSICAAHRNKLLQEIRDHLKRGNKIICVSTQLIEAGVDVSFKCVIRSLAGLDSIAQAAGRCNRHGESELQQVYVIDHMEENLKFLREIKEGKEISKKILIDLKRDHTQHGGNILSLEAMERYFTEFYSKFHSKLEYPLPKLGTDVTITRLLAADKRENSYYQAYKNNKGALPLFLANSYKTAAEHFHVIDDLTTSVIVPYGDEGKDLIADLNGDRNIEDLTRLLRRAQQYTINLFKYELDQLDKNNGLASCLDGKVLVLKEGAYSDEFGLDLENDSGFDLSMY
ncbi:CRISPR-associated helicase Cas3' [Paenibacillus azoreducens]|uniref:CRISPR-associated helicase/endonuclease Cas3 n=1 Tax=Paenibacillus azoreducens TaxID=116718 RepID=A0A919YAC1_9BACL|nr:CRISPR-associated helicase Cas3' [Paenibacillus azoreducens]GIO46739.1 CRISPR-associated helicase/endonuclease Cas3 [Paenibacillus azoreducens]